MPHRMTMTHIVKQYHTRNFNRFGSDRLIFAARMNGMCHNISKNKARLAKRQHFDVTLV